MPGGSNFDSVIRDVLNNTSTSPADNPVQEVGDIVKFPRKFTTQPIGPNSDLSWVPGTPEYNARMDEWREKMLDTLRANKEKRMSGDDL